jgi:biopolymer transport protein ExbD
MAMGSSSNDAPITAINVTPLVDVMLVLLVIFMITAKMDEDHALPLDLPEAASGEAAQRILNVAIDADGKRTLDGVALDDDVAFEHAAAAARARHPDVRTIIQADQRASHGAVMRALDRLRLAGIDKIAFAVDPSS